MTDLTELFNFAMVFAGLMLACLGLAATRLQRSVSPDARRFFLALFSLLAVYTGANLAGQILNHYPALVLPNKIALFVESLVSSLLMPLLTVYLLMLSGESWRKSPLMACVTGLWAAYFALLAITQFTTRIYYFTPDNMYHRGPLYPVLLVPPALIMAANLIGLIRRREKLTRQTFAAFMIYLLCPMAAMLLQMWFFGLYLIVFGTSIAAMCLFLVLLKDEMERHARQQAENARQRASILVLQMRPHFIYNTMMSIYYLCQQDAAKAQQVIRDFTAYLRKNFTAIAREEAVPFPEELEHARVYLAVEQVRYEGRLFVEYDAPHTAFRLPPLTLQPIVENAVKHGVSPEPVPLYITIRTRRVTGGSLITVEDTGPGYAPTDADEPHIALENLRQRLAMAGGALFISSRPSGGTTVAVRVPDEPVR